MAPEEVHRIERWLATARVFLAMATLVTVWINPAEVRSAWAYALLAFYITHGAAIIFCYAVGAIRPSPFAYWCMRRTLSGPR